MGCQTSQRERCPPYIDVFVVGDVPRRVLSRIASEANDQLGVPVNVTRIPVDEWAADDASPFIATVRSRPAVDVNTGGLHIWGD